MSVAELTLTDPTSAPTYADSALSRWARGLIFEARDEVFVRLTLQRIATMSAAMTALWFALHHALAPWWALGLVYFALWGWLTPPVILMLHNTMHRPFFRARTLAKSHGWVMSLFFGIPTGYAEHHVGMHHVEDNMPEDLSSTMRYQRDSFLHFLVYFARFFFLVLVELTLYLHKRKRKTMARRALVGDLVHQSVIALVLVLDWRFGLIAFALPMIACRFAMMAGNWGQHAFLNTAAPNDGLTNSITCINAVYNQRCFNDGYHIGHHLRATRHWTELPKDFLACRAQYASEGAIVFEGIDFFIVSLLLWTGQWKLLARKYVRLAGPMTDDEVIAMLKSRVHPIREWPTNAEAAPLAA